MPPNTFTPFPVLTTERLTLRQLAANDDKEIFALRSNNEVNKYLDRAPGNTIEDAREFIQKIGEVVKQNEGVYWAITLTDHHNVIGTICLFNFSNDNDQAEIGYELLPAFQQQGIMHQAMAAVIEFGFDVLGLKVIEANTHLKNSSSTKLLEKFNFRKQEGTVNDSNNMFIVFKLSST